MSVWPFVLISSLATAAPLRGKVDHAQFVPNEARISLSTVCGEVAVRGESKRQLRISGLIKEDGELQISNEGNHFRLEMRGIHQRRKPRHVRLPRAHRAAGGFGSRSEASRPT